LGNLNEIKAFPWGKKEGADRIWGPLKEEEKSATAWNLGEGGVCQWSVIPGKPRLKKLEVDLI